MANTLQGQKQQGFFLSDREPSVPRGTGPARGMQRAAAGLSQEHSGQNPGPAPPFGNGSDAASHDVATHG